MMRMKFAFIVLSLALFAGCSGPSVNRSHKVSEDWNSDPRIFGDTFDWQKRSPIEFLEVLKQAGDVYYVVGLHHDWIRDSDIEPLINRLDSQVPCACVVSTACSKTPSGRSTEGREAAFLLEGYRRHRYPPDLSSVDYFEPDKEELRRWFGVWKTSELRRKDALR
jgi:hypothetical protein